MANASQRLAWVRTIADVQTLIAPHRQTPDNLPFTAGQLIVIGLVLHDDNGKATEEQVMAQICDNFVAVESLARQQLSEAMLHYRPRYSRSNAFKEEIRQAILSFDVPVTWELHPGQANRLATNLAEAREHLGLSVRKPPQGTSFFDIPPELRQRIYEMVYVLDPGHVHIRAELRDYMCKRSFRDWCHGDMIRLVKPKMKFQVNQPNMSSQIIDPEKFTALSRVSKDVYKEVGATFYSKNLWEVENIIGLYGLFRGGSQRREHITNLSITYDFANRSVIIKIFAAYARQALKSVSELQHLRKMTMKINEDDIIRSIPAINSISRGFEIEKIPGFEYLVNLRGLEEVSFLGRCDRVRQIMVPLLTTPKSGNSEEGEIGNSEEGETVVENVVDEGQEAVGE